MAFQASRRPLADSHKRMSTFPARQRPVIFILAQVPARPRPQSRAPTKSRTNPLSIDLGFVKDGDSTLMFTLTPPQTKDAGIQVSKGCYCFVIDVSGR